MGFFKGIGQIDSNGVLEKITTKTITKIVNIKNTFCNISIEDARVGKIDGKEVILDEVLINSTIEEIARAIENNSSRYNPIPNRILITHGDKNQGASTCNEEEKRKDEFLNIYYPRWAMDNVYLDEEAKKQILTTITMAKYKDKLFNEWGLKDSMNIGRAVVLNFWGPPGTGKSIAAEAIANYLGKQVYSVNYAEMESKYVGETPKNIRRAFQRASEDNAVLIFDEADSFLGKRLTNVSQSADYGVNITRSVMLLELEKFDGVIIFTTNLINNYDDAFKRRILASIEFKLPDVNGRRKIWREHIPNELPIESNITCELLANKYKGISGADIKDIVLYAAVLCLQRKVKRVNMQDFDDAYKYVVDRYASTESIKVTSEIITSEQYESEMSKSDKGHY